MQYQHIVRVLLWRLGGLEYTGTHALIHTCHKGSQHFVWTKNMFLFGFQIGGIISHSFIFADILKVNSGSSLWRNNCFTLINLFHKSINEIVYDR